MKGLTGGLYAIVDVPTAPGGDPERWAAELLDAGVRTLQLRWKGAGEAALLGLAHTVAAQCRMTGADLIINDSLATAAQVPGAGLHLGQGDGSTVEARAVLGPNVWIGRSTHSLDDVRRAQAEPVDYLGFGPVFDGAGKLPPGADTGLALPPRGLALLAQATKESAVPVVAIGGITLVSIPSLRGAGAWCWAPIRALHEDQGPGLRRWIAGFTDP